MRECHTGTESCPSSVRVNTMYGSIPKYPMLRGEWKLHQALHCAAEEWGGRPGARFVSYAEHVGSDTARNQTL